jgi:hypothetical protein
MNTALFNVTNFWNAEFYDEDEHVMIEVRKVHEDTKEIIDVSPLSKIIYKDEKYDEDGIILHFIDYYINFV